jgi:hypothetical protein
VLLTVKESLQYLAQRLQAPIPADVLDRIQRIPVTDDDRTQYKIFSRSFGLIGNLPRRWYVYSRYFAKRSSRLGRVWGFPRFLQHFWRLDHLLLVPFYGLGRGIRRAGNRLFGLPID